MATRHIRAARTAAGLIGMAGLTGLPSWTAMAAPPQSPQASGEITMPTPRNEAVAAESGNQFGLRLFQNLAESAGDRNVFLSPTSLYLALSMAYNGAGGTTQAALGKALALPPTSDLAAVNAVNSALLQSLTTGNVDAAVTLKIADAIWADERSAHFSPDFAARCRTAYGAEVRSLPFSPPGAAVAEINGWVAKNTNEKIKEVIAPDDLPRGADAVLTNAVYFKGAWTKPFRKEATIDGPFHRALSAGGDKNVPMMHATLPAGLLQNETFDAVRLPYGAGRYAFYAFLPTAGTDMKAVLAHLTAKQWREDQGKLAGDHGNVIVEMPRFKVDFSAHLKKPLADLGMGVAFTKGADFLPMGLGANHLSDVVHKAVLEVNEEGSEAAAATAVIMNRTAAFRPRLRTITLDRPFLCLIADDKTGAVLFAGVVNDPN